MKITHIVSKQTFATKGFEMKMKLLIGGPLIIIGMTCTSGDAKQPNQLPANTFSDTTAGNVVFITNEEQLFLDDYLIESSSNVTRKMHPAHKYDGNPVLWPSETWEKKTAVVYGSVIRDGSKYKVWYKAGDGGDSGGAAYAESKDGIHWVKPLLDVVKVEGHKTNLLVKKKEPFLGSDELPTFFELFGVHKDLLDPNPSRRYKMGFLSLIRPYKGPRPDPFHPTDRRGLGVAGSPDGIHWKIIDSFATEAICDGATHWMYDTKRKKYVLYGRTKFTAPEIQRSWSKYDWYDEWHSGRSSARVESSDFLNWNFKDPATAPVVMTADTLDEPGTEIYSMLVFPYESVYIGLIQVFHARPDEGYLDIQLAVSHDSYHFNRVGNRRPFIPVGSVGSWDRFNNSLADNPPIVIGDTMRIYYGGRTSQHNPYKGPNTSEGGGIGFATLERGRFVSMEASFDKGTVTTKPLLFKGSRLFLNANCRFGSIQVSVVDKQGKEVPGYTSTVSGKDNVAIPFPFSAGTLKRFEDRQLTFRFTLSNAQLFGFRIS
jgi:hypothetical protein